jgi:uracil-DNA glycosylase family 4
MSFEEFQNQLKGCRYCKELGFNIEPKPLIWGEPCAKILLISQAPSRSSSECGRPFSKSWREPNPSGGTLIECYDIPEEVLYNPKIFYITGMAHCYPGKRKGGDIKPPLICAEKWLEKELSFLKPKLYVIAGKQAADFIYPNQNYKDLIFNNSKYRGEKSVVIPHPSTANRKWYKEHPEFRTDRLQDIKNIIHETLLDSTSS